MTFLELTDLDATDLVLQLWYDDDSLTLDQAAAIAHDMQQVLTGCAEEWDADAGYVLMPEGDLLDPDGMRV